MTEPERMRGEDAAFLYLEGPTTPYHIASLAIVEGPPPGTREIAEAVAGRLHLAPRLRKRLEFLPLALPRWVDDEHFDLAYHVRRTTVERPGGERQLLELTAELLEQHLDRARPLWECWVIDGLSHGRFALLTKIHHALIDGVSGAQLMEIMFDPTPEPRIFEAPAWSPEPSAGRVRLGTRSIAEVASAPTRLIGRAAKMITSPRTLARRAGEVAAGLTSVARAGLHPVARSPFNLAIGPNRIVAVTTVPLQDLRDIKCSLGGTVNDVVLAAVSGGLRKLLRARDPDVRVGTLRALVPVSLRAGADAPPGNRVAGILAPLPVCEADPGRRLAIIRRETRRAKASPQAIGSELMITVGASLPPPVARVVASAQSVQRFFSLSVTNIPGPPSPLWMRGRRVVEIVPLPPLSANAGLIVAAMSYAGQMTFGIVADRDALPDAGLVAEGIEKSIVRLLHETWGEP